jgi:5'-nucleotidase
VLKTISNSVVSFPKAIIFDTDNTLYPYPPSHDSAMKAVFIKLQKLVGLDQSETSVVFDEARRQIKHQLVNTASSHSRLLYFQRMIELLGMGTRISLALDLEQTYWRTFLTNAQLFDGVLEFLQVLKSKGVMTANVTDLTAQIQFRKMVYFNLGDYFDYIVTSEESGKDKPSSNSYKLAFDKLKIEPHEAWMIGDDVVNDMFGAKKFGLTTFFFSHYYSEVEKCNSDTTDIVFDSFSDLKGFFLQKCGEYEK